MNAKQKLHQAKLAQWTTLIQEQVTSGLTVKEWCAQKNLSIHAYNYWKHILKEAVVDSALPDIVPLPTLPVISPEPSCTYESEPNNSNIWRDSPDLRNLHNPPSSHPVSISLGDIRIEIGSNVNVKACALYS